jgi:flagellar biosynthesis/type III secretory pathway M-ring protein FliF/YscJ
LIDPAVVPSNCGGSIDQCAETLRNQIGKYNIVVLVDTGDNVGLSVKGLSTSEIQQLKTAARNTFTTNGPANGSVFLANSAADKIEANAKASQDASTGSTIFTIVAVALFLLIIGGLVWFLFSRTKKNWQTELQALNEESAKINDYIYRLSGDVDYAFGESGERIKRNFSEATLGMETVNADLRQLATAEPSRLATGWSKWRDKRDETKAKLESIRTNLAQVEREIQSSKQLPGS